MPKEKNIETIGNLRKEIDSLDDKIFEYLARRLKVSSMILESKAGNGFELVDLDRELLIINKLKKKYRLNLKPDFIESTVRLILRESKRQSKIIDKGGHDFMFIAGPCVVESAEQIQRIAGELSTFGIKYLRGGNFKPRTSPGSFQGLGGQGIEYLKNAAEKYEMKTVTEILDSGEMDRWYDMIDIIQVGSRNMSSFGLLKQIGKRTAKDGKPVLLKRGFSSTISEFLSAAEYIISEGNENVILCLRGIRSFEQIDSKFRNTPDLASILEVKARSNLKVIFDPSHASGNSNYVPALSKAAIDLGADGLMVEYHYSPGKALIDGKQSVNKKKFAEIIKSVNSIRI